jgi:hypothetical protein
MFSEPLLAHPAEIGGVHATQHSHPADDDGRDQHDDAGENEQRVVLAESYLAAYDDPRTSVGNCLCACAQGKCVRKSW